MNWYAMAVMAGLLGLCSLLTAACAFLMMKGVHPAAVIAGLFVLAILVVGAVAE